MKKLVKLTSLGLVAGALLIGCGDNKEAKDSPESTEPKTENVQPEATQEIAPVTGKPAGAEATAGSAVDAGEASKIAGSWNLASLNSGGNDIDIKAAETPVAVSFEAEGKFNGNAGCNGFFGEFGLDSAGVLKFGEGVGMTRKMCAPETMAVEDVVVKLFSGEVQSQLSDDSLTLQKDDIKAVFSK